MNKRTILIWFRNDLRINDNEMLSLATDKSVTMVPVYIYDPRMFAETGYGTKKTGVLRARFIQESVLDLQASIRQLDGELIIRYGLPEELLPDLAERYGVDEVYHHREVAHEETLVSARVEAALWKLKLNLRHFIGHTLFHKEDLPFPIKDIPDEFNVFKKKTARESDIRPCISYANDFTFLHDIPPHDIPSLEDLGYAPEDINRSLAGKIKGGEQEAARQLNQILEGALLSEADTGLSPWLSLGCLSVHTLYHALNNGLSSFPKAIMNAYMDELWWHDYYRFMFKKHGNRFFNIQGLGSERPEYTGGDEQFFLWKAGNTPNERVNQVMHRLNDTGYIDYSEQMEAAMFLVHELKVEWLRGAAYFEETLLGYSPATNYGRWAHIAGVGSSRKHNRLKIAKSPKRSASL